MATMGGAGLGRSAWGERQKPLYGGWLEDSGNGHYGGGKLENGSAAEVLFFRDQQRINGVQHHPTRKQNTTCPKNWQRHLNLLRHNVDALCLASV